MSVRLANMRKIRFEPLVFSSVLRNFLLQVYDERGI